MPPRKKHTNPDIANISKNSEWIPGSKMVFEIPDANRVSKSRRITQRFTSSLQTIEKEKLAYMQDIISPPGVKTRLRRQSLIVSKSIPNVSFSVTNSSVSISVSETKSTPKSALGKRVSPSKMVIRKKSSDSVSKKTSSKSSADHVVAERKSRKKSLEANQVIDATKTSNLLNTDEIVAIINNQHGSRKRKSDVSVVDSDEKNKHTKIDSQHLTPTDLRRSPRIAKMKRNKTLKNLKEKTTNKTLQKNKKTDAKIENQADTFAEKVDKGEKCAEDKVEKRTPNRKRSPVKNKKEVKSEVNKKNQGKESPTKMQTPRKSMRNIKDSDKKKEMKLSKSLDVVRTKSPAINEITENRKRGSSAKRKSVRMEEVESEINESPSNVKTSRKRKIMKNAYVDLGEKDIVLIKMTSKKGTPTINRNEEDNQSKKVFEKSVALTTREEQAETECNSVEIENVSKTSGKHVEEAKSDKSDEEERRENSTKNKKEIVNETTSRRVTRQMTSIEQIDSGRKKMLKKSKKTSPSKTIRGTELDSQIVNKSQVLSAKSQKTKKSIKKQKSPKTNFSPQSNIFEKEIVSSKSQKKIIRKPTPTRGVSCKKMSQKKSVASDNESKPSEKKITNISAEVDFENKPQEPLSSDTILSKSATKEQIIIKESIESCKPSSWSFKSLFKNFGKKSSQSESLPKDGKEANENVSTNREMSTEKIPPEKMGLFSVPLLSSTPDIAKNLQEDAKTSFRKSLQKTVSNLSPFGFKKSFEYTRTSIASANNQTVEESVHLQKMEHGKVNNEENTIENNEIQMNVNTAMMSKKMQFECQESEMEMDKKALINDDTSTSDSIDIGFNASVPTKKINVHYESQSEDELVVDVNEESHCSDQEDLISVAKSLHYESQQSEMEDETQMSENDSEEILKEDANALEKPDQTKSLHYESQQSEMEDETQMSENDSEEILKEDANALEKPDQTKSLHYESQQSEMEDETQMSENDSEEILKEDANALEKPDQTKSLHYESQQSEMEDETQMSESDSEEILKEDANALEKPDQTKSLHYESQQSEMEDETQMSESDSEEILKEDANALEKPDQTKSLHYESQQSEMEDETQMSENDSEEILKEDANALEKPDQTKSLHYESQQSEMEDETQMSENDSEEILKEDANALEKPDQAKSLHYESQQSEMEDETQMSENDSEEILKEDANALENLDQEENNLLEPENLSSDGMKSDSKSQQLESEDCDVIGKEFHYESLQSNILVSEIENDFKISEKEEEENFDVNDYNASYSSYGLRCIIL